MLVDLGTSIGGGPVWKAAWHRKARRSRRPLPSSSIRTGEAKTDICSWLCQLTQPGSNCPLASKYLNHHQNSLCSHMLLSEQVLTQLLLTLVWSQTSMFPSSSFPTSYVSLLHPTSDYAPFVRTPILFRISPLVLVSLCTMSLLFPTLDFYLWWVAQTRSGLPSD